MSDTDRKDGESVTVEFSLTDAEHLPSVMHGLLQVHREVSGDDGAAESETAFEERLATAAAKPGWTAAIGYENGNPVGYCHGFTLARDTDWWFHLIVPVPHYITYENGHRTAVLDDIALRKSLRGTGVAARLHDVWLSRRPEERVTLRVDATLGNGALQAACESWGYRRVADRREQLESRVYTAMTRPVRHL
ncbi:N-acetyltransferase [Streptomyces sp. NPDC059070]|uniref:N-acetyltransferase n=1 Tax=unclassified Streptomyces TaxID=2593676 RepID=UPI0034E28968